MIYKIFGGVVMLPKWNSEYDTFQFEEKQKISEQLFKIWYR